MSWVLRAYDHASEQFVTEETLRDVDAAFLQALFSQRSDNPMYDAYRVSSEQAAGLGGHVDLDFDFETNDYFVEYDRE